MKKATKIISVILAVVLSLLCCGMIALADDEHVHSYTATVVPPKCAEQGYTLYVCAGCGDTYKRDFVPASGHIWGAWQSIDDASCTEEGHEQRQCAVCKAYETKTIPVTDHTDFDGNGKCDKCGAELEKQEYIFNPFDWLVQFFNFLREWFAGIFG